MSAHSSRWARGSAGPANPQMRISDAERSEVADRLSKHYSDGRLDQAEFNERLDRAMNAKTQADLNGLFADLPATDEPDKAAKAAKAVRQPDQRPRNRRPVQRVLGLILITVVAIFAARALMWPFFGLFGFAGHVLFVPVPWILIAIVAFVCWRYATRHRRP
jgi:Domain of unknown function (DUF1707)